MQVSSVTMNNADLSTAIASYQKALREDKAGQTVSQQAQQESKQNPQAVQADATVAISAAGQEAYQKSQQVNTSAETDTGHQDASQQNSTPPWQQFDEGSIRQMSGEPAQVDNSTTVAGQTQEQQVAQSNMAAARSAEGDVAKLQNFDIPAMQATA